MKTASHSLSNAFLAESARSSDIVVVFDSGLNYVYVNHAACIQLDRKPEQLIGKSIIDLYPEIIASRNHRSLLRAFQGETLHGVIESRKASFFETFYEPVFAGGQVVRVIVRARPAVH